MGPDTSQVQQVLARQWEGSKEIVPRLMVEYAAALAKAWARRGRARGCCQQQTARVCVQGVPRARALAHTACFLQQTRNSPTLVALRLGLRKRSVIVSPCGRAQAVRPRAPPSQNPDPLTKERADRCAPQAVSWTRSALILGRNV